MGRAGHYVKQPEGFKAFVPALLPPDPPIQLDPETMNLLSEADRAIGRLDGIATLLPNPALFVAMYVRHEAVLSSQIEGTQSTLDDVLLFEIKERSKEEPKDVEEVVNYVRAMKLGLKRLPELPLSLRLIREIHEALMKGARGGNRTPGEFRRSQNWIGGTMPSNAAFVPPPVHEMNAALGNFEKFLHDEKSYPLLIQCGLAHAQFETIHPFLDGNGRVGRLLITFLLCARGALRQPLLYLSLYLKGHRAAYYDRLTAVRNDGDWEGWIKFFLKGVREVSDDATETARRIVELRENSRATIADFSSAALGMKLLDLLFAQPIINIPLAVEKLKCTYPTATKLVEQCCEAGILNETTGAKRNRRYRFEPYLSLFEPPQTTPESATKANK